MHHLGSEQDERKTEGILSLQAFSQWKKQGENSNISAAAQMDLLTVTQSNR